MMAKEPIIHFLKPGEGRAVLRTDGSEWPVDGEQVEETRFVRRRIACKDLIPAEPPAKSDTEDATPEGEADTDAEPAGDAKPEQDAKPAKRARKTKEG